MNKLRDIALLSLQAGCPKCHTKRHVEPAREIQPEELGTTVDMVCKSCNATWTVGETRPAEAMPAPADPANRPKAESA